MAKFFEGKDGKKGSWALRSWEKAEKFAKDLKSNGVKTPDPNSDEIVKVGLSDKQKAYRAGYLACSRDKADEYLLDKKNHSPLQWEKNRDKVKARRQEQAKRRAEYKAAKEAAAKADAEEKKAAKKSTKSAKKSKLEMSPEITNNYSEQVKMDVND